VPRWLRNVLGEDFFSDVHALHINPATMSGKAPPDGRKVPLGPRGVSEPQCRGALVLAAPLRQIRWLQIHQAVVRHDALAQVTCWEQLTALRMDGCDVRDEDLEPLARAANLRWVSLTREPIGNQAITHLRNSRRLRELHLGATNVTDAGLAELTHFPELRELRLFQLAGVSDGGLVHVGNCSELRFLDLTSNAVGDKGMRELAKLPELRYLNVCKTMVTDEGLKHLAPLGHLEEGLFGGTAVTQDGVDQVPSLVKSKSYMLGKPTPSLARSSSAVASP